MKVLKTSLEFSKHKRATVEKGLNYYVWNYELVELKRQALLAANPLEPEPEKVVKEVHFTEPEPERLVLKYTIVPSKHNTLRYVPKRPVANKNKLNITHLKAKINKIYR